MKKLLTLLALTALLFSCSETEGLIPEFGELPINISVSKMTRANDTTYENRDEVGIYVVNYDGLTPETLTATGNQVDNTKFTYSNGAWTPEEVVYWKDAITLTDFYAYYPYSAFPNISAHSFSVRADQSDERDFWASVFLWGKATKVAPTPNAVSIQTNHSLSRILVDVKPGEGFTEESWAAATKSVKICDVKTSATIDLSTGIATATGESSEIIPLATSTTGSTLSYRAMMIPQEVDEISKLVVVTVDGTEYIYRKGYTFKANTEHKFIITVNKSGSNSSSVEMTIGEWIIDDTVNEGVAKEDVTTTEYAAILDIQFNEDGTATDKGIYGFDVQLVGNDHNVDVYKHSQFKANNIARFNHIMHNDPHKYSSYYKVDYDSQDEFKAAIADGFTMEIVTLNTAFAWDWWGVPVATDAFRFVRVGDYNENAWYFTCNENGLWFPGQRYRINATLDKNKYVHNVYVWDADNQVINVYHNGELLGQREDIAKFAPGAWLTIGGFSESDGALMMQWNGEVALVKIYDQPMDADDVMASYTALELPSGPEYKAESFGTPMFDIKFAKNKTASNRGSHTSVKVISKPNDKTTIQNVEGFGNIVDFNNDIHNGTHADGFYRVEYGNDADFISKLQDGFTMEVLCVSNFYQGDFWMRPFSTNKWGIMLKGYPSKIESHWVAFAGATDNSWWAFGSSPQNGYVVYSESRGITKDESFSHLVYVYDAETKEWATYVDGNFNGGKSENNFDVGSVLSICGMPYTDREEMAHGWNGKVAMARIYDKAYNQDAIIQRFEELQPTIKTLNAAIGTLDDVGNNTGSDDEPVWRVRTVAGEVDENNKIVHLDGPFDNCGNFANAEQMCVDPLNPNLVWISGTNSSPGTNVRLLDFENETVTTLLKDPSWLPDPKIIRGVSFTNDGKYNMILALDSWSADVERPGVILLERDRTKQGIEAFAVSAKNPFVLVRSFFTNSVVAHPKSNSLFFSCYTTTATKFPNHTRYPELKDNPEGIYHLMKQGKSGYLAQDCQQQFSFGGSGWEYVLHMHPTGKYMIGVHINGTGFLSKTYYDEETDTFGAPEAFVNSNSTMGLGGSSGYLDGVGLNARIYNPRQGVFVRNPDYAGQEDEYDFYFVDSGNHCIRKVTPQGVVTTFAGRGRCNDPANEDGVVTAIGNNSNAKGYADGLALGEALFSWPRGIAYSESRNSFIVGDCNNKRIREIYLE